MTASTETRSIGNGQTSPDGVCGKPRLTIQQESAIAYVLNSVAAANTEKPSHIILEAVAGAGTLCILGMWAEDTQAWENGHVGGHD
jgi:hypothetical protein